MTHTFAVRTASLPGCEQRCAPLANAVLYPDEGITEAQAIALLGISARSRSYSLSHSADYEGIPQKLTRRFETSARAARSRPDTERQTSTRPSRYFVGIPA